jgi:hypothetical protein
MGPERLFQTCLYCGCDNLAVVDIRALDRASKANLLIAASIEEASALDQQERSKTLRTLREEIARYAFRMGVFAALFTLSTSVRGASAVPAICAFAEVGIVIYWIIVDARRPKDNSEAFDAMLSMPSWVVTLASLALAVTLTVASLLLF